MKISILGAGNVGSLTAMRLAQLSLGDILLVDVLKGLALGKALDLEDARGTLRLDYNVKGTDNISSIVDSDIVVITAGLSRKPGMTREDLLLKNSQILKSLSKSIKSFAENAIIIVVTNPLDLMTYFVLKESGFKKNKVFGMGISLDAARFANIISRELTIPIEEINPVVIGPHGEGMLPLPRHTKIAGINFLTLAGEEKAELIVNKTVNRGAEIVSALGSGSAFFAPSAAIADLVSSIALDRKMVTGVSAYLEGEYKVNGVCLGVPCRIGRGGIEEIIELDLNKEESERFFLSAESISNLLKGLPCMT
ncbi:MAG: malate dehydrogenase [Candidatus Omnitrophota bacterium]